MQNKGAHGCSSNTEKNGDHNDRETVVWNRATKKMYANFASASPSFLRGLESSKGSQVELGD